MSETGTLQIVLFLSALLILIKPLGWYMAQVYEGKPCGMNYVFGFVERFFYRCAGIDAQQEMNWKNYLVALLTFNFFGIVLVYLLQRCQVFLPLNPQAFPAVTPDLAFNTAVSFATNTNWQAYTGESSMSYLTQMLGFTVQNFLSAATGMALVMALIRGITRHETNSLGNFWVDMTRGVLYILLPLALVFALFLSSQGVIQNFKPYQVANLIQPFSVDNKSITQQIIPMGPVASQEAIKQIGTNGGGFFNANSAHPFENPTPMTNFLEMLALLLIPAALCYSFGLMVGDVRQGWALLITMFLIFIPFVCLDQDVEQGGNPLLTQMGINQNSLEDLTPGGNMEGKETRFGIINSTLWTAATTASGNGSLNSMLDSYLPVGGLIPLWLIQLAEVIFGGVGTGLSGMLIFVIITVFVAGLMVGRTPEYLGKKIEPYEMKMASFTVLIMPVFVLLMTAIAAVTKLGTSALGNPGPHGLSEMLYAFSSMVNNNGSAFAGLNANGVFYNVMGGLGMLIGRYWAAIPTLAIAGALARKKTIPSSSGTLPTNSLLFILLLLSVVLIFGALTFFPVLALGPIVEQLILGMQHVH